jgi:hypothetical protein
MGHEEGAARTQRDHTVELGGAIFHRLLNGRISDDRMMTAFRALVVASVLFAWLPLLLLTAVEGTVFRENAAVPFLADLEVHVRFLLVLPLLMIAEVSMDRRLSPLAQLFLDRNLIPEDAETRFEKIKASWIQWRESVTAEVLLVAFVYFVGVLIIWRHYVALEAATWYATPAADGPKFSAAGTWYEYVSLPIFQFVLFRWYFWLLGWARVLWQLSRIELNLVPTHPDRVGGLGFVSQATRGLSVLAVAHGTLLAGYLATRVLVLGFALTQFKAEIALMVIFVLSVTLGPLLVFRPQLVKSRSKGFREYGTLAGRYVREFDIKWLRHGAVLPQSLLGSSDIQSLANLDTSYDVIRKMRISVVSREILTMMVLATLLPTAPLLLTMMSVEELARELAAILF